MLMSYYMQLLHVVNIIFNFHRELQYLLYLPEQLFPETQNCALNLLNAFCIVVQRQRTIPTAKVLLLEDKTNPKPRNHTTY